MDSIEKYNDPQLVQRIVPLETSADTGADSPPNLIAPILRRWYIVLITFLVICAIGIPSVWLLIKPTFVTTAAIRVAPVIPSILFSDKESEGVMPMYQNFMNTQASLIKSDPVLQRVADDLVDKKLKFSANTANPVAKLKKLLASEGITVTPGHRSELIIIKMENQDTTEAVQIVNSIVKAYMAIEASRETKGGDRKLTILESEKNVLMEKLERQRKSIRQMAEEYGTLVLTERQEMMFERVATIQSELTKLQTKKITCEARVKLLESTSRENISPENMLKLRYDFINSDATIQVISQNIAQLEQSLVVSKQRLASTNPVIKQKQELLETMKQRLEERSVEMGLQFDKIMEKELTSNNKNKLANLKVELGQLTDYEQRLVTLLARENTKTIEMGRKHLAIQDMREQLELTKELYGTVRRRLQELEMERKRPARISIAYNASVNPLPNKRVKYTAAIMFGSLAAGCFIALLIGKVDHSFYSTNDITKHIGVRIIGTTTNTDYVDTLKLPQQIVSDYQTIRANLGFLNGDSVPKKLVVTSPGIRDGKTTFSINLATSLAEAGKKVLLIDGDLRKPDIRGLLNIERQDSKSLQAMLEGETIEKAIYFATPNGFDLLSADSKTTLDVFELLSQPLVKEKINELSDRYDHIVIDTPPVLAFPDALIWARMADGVILTSFAGRTDQRDFEDTIERLKQINAKILGTILNSVRTSSNYNRYGYSYYTDRNSKTRRRRRSTIALLLPSKQSDEKKQ